MSARGPKADSACGTLRDWPSYKSGTSVPVIQEPGEDGVMRLRRVFVIVGRIFVELGAAGGDNVAFKKKHYAGDFSTR